MHQVLRIATECNGSLFQSFVFGWVHLHFASTKNYQKTSLRRANFHVQTCFSFDKASKWYQACLDFSTLPSYMTWDHSPNKDLAFLKKHFAQPTEAKKYSLLTCHLHH
ncbi:unnamed protein product [Allacma fusca]|uniref:Uncharacterized protein n=1 Tax=Allacma fusca TaxID=39272 RepID=A0A8J2JKN3_9HEXA|nr:unnamed protein product [Allacma fusca]